MPRQSASAANAAIQASILKNCDRTNHRPESNKKCANDACQHTCEPEVIESCPHKWTVRYSVNSRQREKSFETLEEAQTFQVELTANKKTQGSLYVDPAAGNAPFLPQCARFIDGMDGVADSSKKTYRSNFSNPEVTKLFEGKTVAQAARMRDEVKELVNKTLGHYGDVYRGNIRYIITGTLDDCVSQDIISRHTLGKIKLGPRTVTAEQYEKEAERRKLVTVSDEVVQTLAEGLTVQGIDRRNHLYTRRMPGLGIAVWLQRTMGLRIREALGVRKSDFKERPDGSRYLHLCWQATENGTTLEPLKHRKAGEYRDVPVPDMVWYMVQALPDGPLCPGIKTPYMPYSTAANRLGRMLEYIGIKGVHTHSLRHQFATEALEADPRELANISAVLGHEDIETTLKFYIHTSKDAEQRIGNMMNNRWKASPGQDQKPKKTRKRASRATVRPVAAAA